MSFTVLPLSQPQGRTGSNGFTHRNGDVIDVSVHDLLGGSRPTLRDDSPKVLDSKIDVKKVAMLWSRGVMPNEISEVMGLSDVILDELMRSEEFTVQVNALLATREITSLDKALESTAAEALVALRDLLKNSGNDAVKAKCAMYVIDQHRGKAPQHIQLSSGKITEDPKGEAERLKKMLGFSGQAATK